MTVVKLVWGSIGIPAFGHDQNVGKTTERIGENGDRAKVDIGVVTWCLSGRGTIKIPFWELLDGVNLALWGLGESLYAIMVSIVEIRTKSGKLWQKL